MNHKRSSPWRMVGVAAVLVVAEGLGACRVEREPAAASERESAVVAEGERALAALATALRSGPNDDVSLARRKRVQAINRMNDGILLYKREDVAGAEKALQDAIQIDPTYAVAHHTLGQIYKKQNKLADAEVAFQAAVTQMGAEPSGDYYYDLGTVQSALGTAADVGAAAREASFRAAIDSFQAALKLNPRLYKASYRMGTLCEKLAMLDRADAAYRMTIEIMPAFSPAYGSLAQMLLDRGDTTTAMAVLHQGTRLNDRDPHIWNSLGLAHFRQGQMVEAVDAYAKAKAIDPDNVNALYGLGMAHAELRQRKEAQANLKLFLDKASADTGPDLLKAARDTLARLADGKRPQLAR